jgi:hypothetical protein
MASPVGQAWAEAGLGYTGSSGAFAFGEVGKHLNPRVALYGRAEASQVGGVTALGGIKVVW